MISNLVAVMCASVSFLKFLAVDDELMLALYKHWLAEKNAEVSNMCYVFVKKGSFVICVWEVKVFMLYFF